MLYPKLQKQLLLRHVLSTDLCRPDEDIHKQIIVPGGRQQFSEHHAPVADLRHAGEHKSQLVFAQPFELIVCKLLCRVVNTGNAENDIQILLTERCHVLLGETLIQHVGSAFTVQSCIFHIGTGNFQKVLMADIVTAVHEVGETEVDTVGIRSKDHIQWLRAVDDSGQTVFFQTFVLGIYRVSQGRAGKPRIGIRAESIPRDEIVRFFRGVGLLYGSALLLLCDFSALIRR